MITPSTGDDHEDALEAAKQKLSEMRGRPFDVDKILAEHRVKEGRKIAAERRAREKLEQTIHDARERRHTIREHELESENKNISEKQEHFKEAKLKEKAKIRRITNKTKKFSDPATER